MAIEISWYIPDVLVLERFYDVVTIDDMQQANSGFYELVKSLAPDQPIHLLVDRRDVTHNEPSLAEVIKVSPRHPDINMGLVALVEAKSRTSRALSNFILSALGQLLKFDYRSFETMEAALTYLAENDQRIAAHQQQQTAST